MQASIFNATERVLAPFQMILKIPVYKHNYDWNKNNVKRLLDDLHTVIKTKEHHFLGAVIYLESTNSDIGLPEYLIIDGQQRLTTITLMRSEEHTSELQSRFDLVCRLLLEKKKK